MDNTPPMTAEQIVEYLRQYNEWRRGNDAPQLDPTNVGNIIDAACDALENPMRVSSVCRELTRERDEALEELENYKAQSVHTCNPNCQRPMCVLRRERDEARGQLDAERALADRLAGQLDWLAWLAGNERPNAAELAILAWKEARSE
jgi:hypothetical protein